MSKTIRNVMHNGLVTCPPAASLGQVAALLNKHHVHALIVAETAEEPLGIISDFDLLAGEWLSVDETSLGAMRKMTARDLMTAPIASIDVNTSVVEAAKTMIEKQIHRMMVTENGKAIGIISISNFVADIASQEKAKRESVGDVMSDTFLVCRDKTSILSAARTMSQAGWRSIVVVNPDGKPVGVVTGNDLMRFVGNTADENITVSDVMNRNLITIDINATLQQAADIMIREHKHRVLVVDEKHPESFPLGIISSFDIVALMARPGSIWQS